jgi:L-fuculose-phosphate aldolase
MNSIPEFIVEIGRLIFERRLTDIAGGNISARDCDRLYITPTGAGKKQFWQVSPSDIVSARVDTDELMENPRHSNESISHLLVYRAFPEVQAIIHAHPFHVAPFIATLTPIKPLNLAAKHYGVIEYIPELPQYSREQGEAIVSKLAPQRDLMGRLAAAVLIPRHGIFVAGKNLYTTVDCLERVDTSAWTNLSVKWLE